MSADPVTAPVEQPTPGDRDEALYEAFHAALMAYYGPLGDEADWVSELAGRCTRLVADVQDEAVAAAQRLGVSDAS